MSDQPASEPLRPQAVADMRSPLSDGEWHRLHPLTPVLRGGLFLIVVLGIVITNLRDRLIVWFFPGLAEWEQYESGDPVDYVLANNLVVVALLAALGILLLLLGIFWLSWRFHTFRITGDDVEVRSGVLFRTHRRAPLDRVQGVNLTRPMVARLLGAAKLEVVGAGLDANVKLEYLSTANAEAVRADILRLASGRQLAEAQAQAQRAGGVPRTRAAVGVVSAGITGLIDGVDGPESEPESVVHIPPARLVASHLLSGSTIWLIVLIAAVVVGAVLGTPWVLFSLVPALIGFGTYWFRSITRALRYSIAPTRTGVRITFGLFTTITETLPPGRVHAFEIRQPLLWRGFGWWQVRVNRLSGRSAADAQSQQFADVLPVGTRDDVERVLRLFLPGISAQEWTQLAEHGLVGPRRATDESVEDVEDGAALPAAADPYTTTPRRARLLKPLSWRRNGFLLSPAALLLRRGRLRRDLAILPLARLQSVHVRQGPLARWRDVANVTADTVLGPVSGRLGAIDRAAAMRLWQDVAVAVVAASAGDRSHRWGEEPAAPESPAAAESLGEAAELEPTTRDPELGSRAERAQA